MIFYDSQLLSVDGVFQDLGVNYTIDLSNLMYCIPSTGFEVFGAQVDTFTCFVHQPNRIGITQVKYKRNGRTITDFLADMNTIGGGEPLKLWYGMRNFSGKLLPTNDFLYNSTAILNDNFQSNCVYLDTVDMTSVYLGSQLKQISLTTFLFAGNQIGSAPLYDENLLPVYKGLAAQGTTSATTSILKYGVNVFDTVTGSDFAAKLPQPVTGKTVRVVNMSSNTLVLFPSNIGGRINNLPVNTPAQIPADGNLYQFTCIENPLPGAWTWTAPATAQYDSGVITTNMMLTDYIVAANSANVGLRGNFNASAGWGYNGRNLPLVQSTLSPGNDDICFKEATPWLGITKIKVYTNLSATLASVTFALMAGSQHTYYTPNTNTIVDNGIQWASNYSDASASYGYCDKVIAGTPLGYGVLAANIGDPGTCWGEIVFTGGNYGQESRIGDIFTGTSANPFPPPAGLVDGWFSGYASFQMTTSQTLTGFQFRFFVEHY